jgi:uncharacterized membrane protein
MEFFEIMKKTLVANKVADIDDIVSEYEQHFVFKLADGYAEEEIAAKLGDPKELANQFTSEKTTRNKSAGNRIMVASGLVFTDFFAASFFIILYAWAFALGALAVASAVTGTVLLFGQNIYGLLPFMPYSSALLFAISMFLIAILAAVGTLYCVLFFNQLLRAYRRWHHNAYALVSDKPVYPPLAMYPQVNPKTNRRLRSIALIELLLFAVFFVATFIVSSISAGSFGFWHAWNWFQ